ncbi:MAG TPA: glycosyltransferase [Bryobacteraceae bacterium]|jgi:glycosyltransferase involved in cell wall biosynthesis|nr:glycosyltransferase [Bryobacteraceae bacterium]
MSDLAGVKVLHVIPSIAAVHGGPSVMVEMMARGLSQSGVDIHIAATNDDGAAKLDVPCEEPVLRDGVTYWFFNRQTNFYKFSLPLSRWLSRHVTDYRIVHIHALFSHSSYAASHWAQRRGVPYIVRPLGVLNRWGMENRRPWLKDLSFRMIEKRILANASLVHYTSEQERAEAALLGVESKSVVIPNPIPAATGSAAPGTFMAAHPELAGRQIILFLSRFDRKKGLELLLPAYARVRQTIPGAALVLAGAGDAGLVRELKIQAESLGIADDIVWAGFLQNEAKIAAFADAAVFALPSWSENFGVAVIEAMAAGCAVVVSDQVAVHTDIAAANAGYVVPCEVEALAGALCRALEDPPARAIMGFNGKCLTQTHYSPEAVTAKLTAAYRSILS